MAAKKKTKKKVTHRTEPPPLSAIEVRFCRLYVELGNATEAALQAGLVSKNRVSLAARAYQLLKKLQIRALIRRMQSEAADAEQVTVNRLAQSMSRAAFADRTKIFYADGRMKPPHLWPDELRSIVTGFDVEEETVTSIDPATGNPVTTTTVKYKPRFRTGTEETKKLAEWRGMIGRDAASQAADSPGIVVEGEPS